MNRVFIHGTGAVSPAGWGIEPLRRAVERGEPLPTTELARPGSKKPLTVRTVPSPKPRPAFLGHARLRRSSAISQYAVAAALEALGNDSAKIKEGSLRLGVVFCAMSGCVNYSRRFYDEVLREPATASPLVFPETVFNAPSSHLAALLGTTAVNYTLVGDPGTFLQGLALGAQWLNEGLVNGCVVVGCEEMDWLTADAFQLFTRRLILSDGAGALYLRSDSGRDEGRPAGQKASRPEFSPAGPPACWPAAIPEAGVELAAITDSYLFRDRPGRVNAARLVAKQLRSATADWLCNGLQNVPRLDEPDAVAWADWRGRQISPKRILGEGLMAAATWQCALACTAVQRREAREALVSVVGCNQQAIGASFRMSSS